MVHVLNKSLAEFIRECYAAGGVPQIVEKYAMRDFLAEGMVLVRCWGAKEKVKGGLIKLSPTEIEIVRRYAGERNATALIAEALGIARPY